MSEERREALRGFGQAILIVRLQGFIFFGTSDRLRKKIEDRLSELVRFLIIDFRHVTGVDSSAVVSFVRLGKVASRRGFTMVITGMNEPVERALTRGGLAAGASLRIDRDIDHGLVWCENRLLARLAPDLDVEGATRARRTDVRRRQGCGACRRARALFRAGHARLRESFWSRAEPRRARCISSAPAAVQC